MVSIGVYKVGQPLSTARFDVPRVSSTVEVVNTFNLRFPTVSKEDAGLYRVTLNDASRECENRTRSADTELLVQG